MSHLNFSVNTHSLVCTISLEKPYFLVHLFNCCLTGNTFVHIEHISINASCQLLLFQVAQQHQQHHPIAKQSIGCPLSVPCWPLLLAAHCSSFVAWHPQHIVWAILPRAYCLPLLNTHQTAPTASYLTPTTIRCVCPSCRLASAGGCQRLRYRVKAMKTTRETRLLVLKTKWLSLKIDGN